MEQVHVISLNRSQERRRIFAERNAHLDYVFVDAVDGEKMSPAQWRDTGLFARGLPYTAGGIGCALSHLRLWEQGIASGRPITIAEDDAVFRLDFHEMQAQALARLPENWDFILWGWNFDSVMALNLMPGTSPSLMLFSQDLLRKSIKAFQYMASAPTVMPLLKAFGIPAYTLSMEGARRFRSMCFPLEHFELDWPLHDEPVRNNGIDIPMNRAYPLTASHACMPPLVITPNERERTTIQTGVLRPT